MLNGNELLQKHISEGKPNAQFTSRFSAKVLLIITINWIEGKRMCRLQESPYFSILADKCQNISTKEELSICSGWLVNGKSEEQFLTKLHVHFTDA